MSYTGLGASQKMLKIESNEAIIVDDRFTKLTRLDNETTVIRFYFFWHVQNARMKSILN